VGATALNALSLQIYYRYGKVLGGGRARSGSRRPARATPESSPSAPSTAPKLDADDHRGIETGKQIDKLKDGRGGSNAGRTVDGARRTVLGKQFEMRGGIWTDMTWKSAMTPTVVQAFSDEYLALARANPQAAKYFAALGDQVIVVIGGKAYRVQP
jgi:hypothetical protein